jgi:hypothetical protein
MPISQTTLYILLLCKSKYRVDTYKLLLTFIRLYESGHEQVN